MSSPLATICVQTHGNRVNDFRRCLGSILEHTPAGVFELRLGFNQAGSSLHHAIGMLSVDGAVIERDQLPGGIERFIWSGADGITVHTWQSTANGARDMMTRLFCHDVPLVSDYLIAFDDDAYVTAGWWEEMQSVMEREIDYFGRQRWTDYLPDQADLIKVQPWYSGVPFLKRKGRHGGLFMTGFLGVRTVRLQTVTLPHCGDAWKGESFRRFGSDIVLGEMARQLGWSQTRHDSGVRFSEELPNHEPSANGNSRQPAKTEEALFQSM